MSWMFGIRRAPTGAFWEGHQDEDHKVKSIKSKLARTAFSRLAAGCVLVAGFALAAVSPALADGWHGDNHGGYHGGGYYHGGYYGGYRGPVYVQPRPVIVA